VQWIAPEGDTLGRHLVTSLRLPTSDLRDAWIDRLSASGAHSRAEVEKAAEDVPFPRVPTWSGGCVCRPDRTRLDSITPCCVRFRALVCCRPDSRTCHDVCSSASRKAAGGRAALCLGLDSWSV
jgi:hypothetical protein